MITAIFYTQCKQLVIPSHVLRIKMASTSLVWFAPYNSFGTNSQLTLNDSVNMNYHIFKNIKQIKTSECVAVFFIQNHQLYKIYTPPPYHFIKKNILRRLNLVAKNSAPSSNQGKTTFFMISTPKPIHIHFFTMAHSSGKMYRCVQFE